MSAGIRLAWEVVRPGARRRDTAWTLLRTLLPPSTALSNPCPRCGGPHGPVRTGGPYLASVSYAGGIAVVGVVAADAASAFGIDAEPDGERGRLTRVLSATASVRDWIRIEAVLKADGRGLRVDPARVRIEEADAAWTALLDGTAYLGADLAGPPGILVSAAMITGPRRGAMAAATGRATP